MRQLTLAVVFALVRAGVALSQAPFVPDSTTRALWHFDEISGSTVVDAAGRNNGNTIGTKIVTGRFGNARSFNGTSDYILVPTDSSLDVGDSSFTLDVWFRTTTDYGFLVRRGMAPAPGYNISIFQGRIGCQIGNREDSAWPDTVLTIVTPAQYNDGAWHLATMVRDTRARTLSLYADGVLAAPPINDKVTFPLNCTRPLTIGRWEGSLPDYFAGVIDEVRLTVAHTWRRPVAIFARPATLAFGNTRVATVDSLNLEIANSGYSDTLRVLSMVSSNQRFLLSLASMAVAPGTSRTVPVYYNPMAAQADTGTLQISSNDPASPIVRIPLSGNGFALQKAPFIAGLALVPNSPGQARIRWYRSVDDSAGAPDPVIQYSVWRMVPADGNSSNLPPAGTIPPVTPTSKDVAWDFIQSIPAIGLIEYAAIVPVLNSITSPASATVFMVVAQARSSLVYSSAAETLLVPLTVTDIGRPAGDGTVRELTLGQNYPNPFNPSTTIKYELPKSSMVRLSVYDILGREVSVLVNERKDAGSYEVKVDGSNLASGVYFYRLQAGNFVQTRKLILTK